MKVKKKVLPPAYHLEFMSMPELAIELNIPKYDLLKYLRADGMILKNNLPSEPMLLSGYMFCDFDECGRNTIMVTSKGYFFFTAFFKKHLRRHKRKQSMMEFKNYCKTINGYGRKYNQQFKDRT